MVQPYRRTLSVFDGKFATKTSTPGSLQMGLNPGLMARFSQHPTPYYNRLQIAQIEVTSIIINCYVSWEFRTMYCYSLTTENSCILRIAIYISINGQAGMTCLWRLMQTSGMDLGSLSQMILLTMLLPNLTHIWEDVGEEGANVIFLAISFFFTRPC